MQRKLIVSFDGGGVKALFFIEMIQHIERQLGRPLAEVCDLFVGVSAGALVAAALATDMRMDMAGLQPRMQRMFDRRNSNGPLLETIFDGTGKTQELQLLLGQTPLGSCAHPLVVLAATLAGELAVFSSWSASAASTPLANVLDASTAAPAYFPAVQVNHEWYIDGGVASNDPALAGLTAARGRWGHDCEYAILSFGAGHLRPIIIKDQDPCSFGLIRLLQNGLLDIVMRADQQQVRDALSLLLGPGLYLRICSNVAGALDDTSEYMRRLLVQDAADVWATYNHMISSWLQKRARTE